MPDTFFTPPHRNRFVPYVDPDLPDTDTEPLRSLKPTTPRPVNLWLHDDGLLHESQPPTYNRDTKMFAGGHMYGPLSQEDIDLLTNSGYSAYLHDTPTLPEP